MVILQVVRTFTEELVGRFRPMIVRLAASITRDEFQAEDIDVTYCNPADLNNIEGEPDIHAFTDEHGFSDEIAALLAALSLEERTLIAYRYGDGYSFREIEKLTGIPATTLRKRMQRCKAKLREQIRREVRHD